METNKCVLCGEPMPESEQMFKYHGYSGPCPKPPIKKEKEEFVTKSAYLKLQEELAEARRVIEYYGDTSLGETGAWAFEKKFVFGKVQTEDMELLSEPLGAKGERYAIGGKRAREFLAKYKKETP